MEDSDKRLYSLDELSDYKVDSDDPDVRGWEVKDADGRVVGTVDNLLVNKNSEKVVYLDVEVDTSVIEAGHEMLDESADDGIHEFENSEGEDHLIIPIGLARLNEDEEYVYTDELTHQTFAKTKRFKEGKSIPSDYERYIISHYGNEDTSAQNQDDEDFYKREEFNRSKNRR